jgi:cell division septation protein DedD
MGVMVVPINEWAEAPAGVKPLGMRRVAQVAPPPLPVVATPVTAAKPTVTDTIKNAPVTMHAPDTAAVSKIAVAQEKPTEQSVTLTVPFSKIEKSDSVKPLIADSTKKVVPLLPPKTASHDTTAIVKAETKKDVSQTGRPPVAEKPIVSAPVASVPVVTSLPSAPVQVKPKVAEPVVSAPKVESPPSAPVQAKPKVAEPVVSAPKVESPPSAPVEAKHKVVEPVVSAPKVVAPPAPPTIAPAETLKAVKVETSKAVDDTSVARTNVVPTKRALAPHDKPLAAPGKWYIQVGAFGNFDNAHRLATTLQKAGYPIKLVPRDAGTKKLLQVRVGGYENRDACTPVADELKSKYNVPTVIISE